MKDRDLIKVTEIVDDDTGMYTVGELDFGICGVVDDFLKREPENRLRLIKMLRFLADKLEKAEPPFSTFNLEPFNLEPVK